MVPELVLDPQLRYWVLLPISLLMVLVGILRIYITSLLTPSTNKPIADLLKLQELSFLQKSVNFRKNCFTLPNNDQSYEARKNHLHKDLADLKYLSEKPASKNGNGDLPANPFLSQDPSLMTDMLTQMVKSNLMNYIPQTLIMWWVNFFFAGFVIMKLPFPLTLQFKSMLQNGVMTPDLDVRWVSSISWYFVNLLGLRAIYSLIFDESEVDSTMQQQQQQTPLQPLQMMVEKMMRQELDNVQILTCKSCLDDVEDRVLELYS